MRKQTEGIKIEGHRGTWYIIGTKEHNGRTLFLLESENYGDEAPALIVDSNYNVIMDEVWNGFSDLEEADFTIEVEDDLQ